MLLCPYCNAQTRSPESSAAGQRVTCDRCGEAFVAWESGNGAAPDPQSAMRAQRDAQPPSSVSPFWPNLIFGTLILLGMFLVALLTLLFALATESDRREVDTQKPVVETLSVPLLARIALGVYVVVLAATVLRSRNRSRTAEELEPQPFRRGRVIPIAAVAAVIGVGLVLLSIQTRPARQPRPNNQAALVPVPAVSPADLAALAYLPADTNVIAGFHVAEALQNPLSRDFLLRSSLKLGDVGFDGLERWTGLRFPEIDHAVLGIKLDDHFPPRAMLVVRTHRPIDENAVHQALRASAIRERDGRSVFRFNPEGSRLEAFAWRADEITLILSLNSKDFDQVSAPSRPGGEHLPAPIQSYLRDRVKSAPVWAVGHVADWAQTPAQLLAAELKDDWRVLSGIRTFGSWLQFSDEIRFSAACECKNTSTAQSLLDYFTTKEGVDRRGLAKFVPSFDHEPLVRELSRSAATTQEGDWVTLQARAAVETPQPRPTQ